MDAETLRPIVVIKKGAASSSAKADLRKSGYIVIESDDLECVKIMNGWSAPVDGDLIFHCAMEAINSNGYTNAKNKFGELLSAALAKQSAP